MIITAVVLLLLIAVAFVWIFMAGVTERKTGQKNYWFWPFVLTYWYGKGRPKPVKQTETLIDSDPLSENIKKLNETICSLIQKMEEREKKIQTQALKKAKQAEELKSNNTNQGE